MLSKKKETMNSFWQVFRIIFVLFSLYLLGDAFFRWDGFSYYASFSEFLPAVSLASILWSIIAVITATLLWLLCKTVEWICKKKEWNIGTVHILFLIHVSALLVGVFWIMKRIFISSGTSLLGKQVLLLSAVLIAIFFTWLFRNKIDQWMKAIEERITPLVWIFGIFVILSIPLVTYHTWIKDDSERTTLKEVNRQSNSDKNQPNIILVTFDAMTARNMSVYGYHRQTTPFISKWAESASLFTKAISASNMTTPSAASLMTGQRVWTHQTYHLNSRMSVRNDKNIASLLQRKGYYNMAFVENPNASPEGLDISKSFHYIDNIIPIRHSNLVTELEGALQRLFYGKIALYQWILLDDFKPVQIALRSLYFPVRAKFFTKKKSTLEKKRLYYELALKTPFNRFLSFIKNDPPEPYFAWIHLVPPHAPYLPPEPFIGIYDSSQKMRTYAEQKLARSEIDRNGYFTQELMPTINTLRSRYDEYIRYSDKMFKNFIEQLHNKDMLGNTAIILSSDHGESFEHDFITHGGPLLYEQLTHVPLIVKEPNQTVGLIIDNIVEHVDISSTILDLAGLPAPAWIEGRSLIPLMHGEEQPDKFSFSMNFENNRAGQSITKGSIAVWDGEYKLIHYLHNGNAQLFNLKKDPDEVNNLFDSEPAIAKPLLVLIKDNLKAANENMIMN